MPEVSEVDDDALTLRWNKVDVPAFSYDDEPLSFMIERQSLPGYQWEPVATNLTGSSYRVRDLKPYQDYAFRVRGVYPSGYTEPSPNVPVYRRPSESKISLASRHVSSSDSLKLYSSANQNLPTQSLRASLPSEFSPIHKTIKKERSGRSYSYSPERRHSLPYIFSSAYSKLSFDAQKYPISSKPEPASFKVNNAYVYNRRRVEDILPDYDIIKRTYRPVVNESKVKTLADAFDGMRGRAFARRHSDVGVGISTRHKSLPRDDMSNYYDSILEEKKLIFRNALMQRSVKPRSSSVPKFSSFQPELPPKYPYRSVADRYEDIKLKYSNDYKLYTAPDAMAASGKYLASNSDRLRKNEVEYVRPEYYDGTFFIIEDEMNLDYKMPLPRVSRVDMKLPASHRSLSYDRDPGYLMVSKFSLLVSGVRQHSPNRSAQLTPEYRKPVRSNTPVDIVRSQERARSLTPDYRSYNGRSRSFSPSLKQYSATNQRQRAMSFTPETYQAASSMKQKPVTKPRSNSISIPSPSRQTVSSDRTMTKDRALAAILIDKSRSLVDRYQEIPGNDTLIRPRGDSLSLRNSSPLRITASSHRAPSLDRTKTSILIDQSKSLINKYEHVPQDSSANYQRRNSISSTAYASLSSIHHESVVPRKSSVSINLSRRDLDQRSKSRQPRSRSLSVQPRSRGSVADIDADKLRLKLDSLVGRLCSPAAKTKHYTPKVTCSRMREESASKSTK